MARMDKSTPKIALTVILVMLSLFGLRRYFDSVTQDDVLTASPVSKPEAVTQPRRAPSAGPRDDSVPAVAPPESRPAACRIRVRDEANRPIVTAAALPVVENRRFLETSQADVPLRADDAGVIHLNRSGLVDQRLIVFARGYVSKEIDCQPMSSTDVVVNLAEGVRLSGKVSCRHQPLAGVTIAVSRAAFSFASVPVREESGNRPASVGVSSVHITRSGADGSFELTGLEPGDYGLVAKRNGYVASNLPSSCKVEVPQSDLEIEMTPLLAVVVGAETDAILGYDFECDAPYAGHPIVRECLIDAKSALLHRFKDTFVHVAAQSAEIESPSIRLSIFLEKTGWTKKHTIPLVPVESIRKPFSINADPAREKLAYGEFRFRVLSRAGQSLDGVPITIEPTSPDGLRIVTRSGEERRIPQGRYAARISNSDFKGLAPTIVLDATADGRVREITFQLNEDVFAARIVLKSRRGLMNAYSHVRILKPDGETRHLRGNSESIDVWLPYGRYVAVASIFGFLEARSEFAIDDDFVRGSGEIVVDVEEE